MMHFICPECDRPLPQGKRWHYCKKVEPGSLFTGKPLALITLFNKLAVEVGAWEGVSFSATKNCLVFIHAKTFLVIRVLKKEIDLWFTLPEETDDFPIYKKATYGKKTEYYIRLGEPDELDKDVFIMLRKAYDMHR
jgi:hypothetical protein